MTFVLREIQHGFGNRTVLNNITFSVKPGEVHALLGMNGAGKSTLLQILAGVYVPDRGQMEIDGKPITLRSPADAAAHGIVFLTQEVDRGLVPNLSVHENLTVFVQRKEKRVFFRRNRNRERAKQLLSRFGLDVDVNKRIHQCSLYEKQVISVVRALSHGARYLLLDEPTASFDRKEAERFAAIIRQLKEESIGIVFVSHRMAEVFSLAERVTVLRNGNVVLAKQIGETSMEETIQAMTGGISYRERERQEHRLNQERFAVHDLTLRPGAKPVSFGIGKGEIVVVFGLLGSGKTELAETIFGLRQRHVLSINGQRKWINSPRSAVKSGLAFIPEERAKQGLWKRYDIRTHLSLPFRGWIFKRRELAYSQQLINEFTIYPGSPHYQVGTLSGGNQQKVAIAKWVGHTPEVILLDEPMKGIDVAAKEAIFQQIEAFAQKGTSILYFTAEPDEALRVADRILILSQGEIVRECDPSDYTIEQLLLEAEGDRKHDIANTYST